MKLSLCVNSAAKDFERTEAMRLAARLGYKAVEFWEGKDFDLEAYKTALSETNLSLACMGSLTGLVDPATRQESLGNFKISLANAKALGAKGIIATTGQELEGVPREKQRQSIVEGLKEAAKIVSGSGIRLYLEPLNVLVNHAGYYLYSSAEAFGIVREVNSPDVKVLFDIYHQQITEGNLIANIVGNIDLIGHFHVAGNPGRGEPYLGEINYKEVFAAIDAAGYEGYAGLEFWPKGDLEESLKKCLELYQ
jgi:hydroxypyruvate isomerase